MASTGAMSAEQYDGAIYDLVFLAYTAEPKADLAHWHLCSAVFGGFLIFAWLNREYWKDVTKPS